MEENAPLLRKYRQLLEKHDALVRRLAEQNVEHISTFKLSSWALETSASGLALLRGGRVALANSRWHEMVRWPGPWRWRGGANGEAPRSARTVREVAIEEMTAVLATDGPRFVRYRQEAGERVVEVSAERVANPGEVLCWSATSPTRPVRRRSWSRPGRRWPSASTCGPWERWRPASPMTSLTFPAVEPEPPPRGRRPRRPRTASERSGRARAPKTKTQQR